MNTGSFPQAVRKPLRRFCGREGFFAWLLAFPLAAAAASEPVSLSVTPPAEKVRLAEAFEFKVEASLPEHYTLKPATAAPEGSDFELLSFARSAGTGKDGLRTETFRIKAKAFALGVSTFPALSWRVGGAGTSGAEVESSSFTVEVLPLFKTGEGEDIRDIYPPFRYFPWPWLLALALAAAAAYYFYRRRRAANAGPARASWTDPRSPYQRARDRLEGLEKSPLAAAGKLKEFYTGLTAVLRLYLAEEFSIYAAQMTTAVLGRELKRTGADIKTALRARELLQKSDLVKFARFKPGDAEADSRALEELLMEFHRAAENAKLLAARAMESDAEKRAAENAKLLAARAMESDAEKRAAENARALAAAAEAQKRAEGKK